MPPSAQPSKHSTPSPASGAGQVLIIDDGDAVRDVIRIALEKRGFQVCGEAADGVEAIEKAKALKPDVIILDLAMPRMNGMEAAAVLSRIMPDVPIVLLTMYGDFVGASLASVSGIKAVISKTDGLETLVASVESLLQTRRQITDSSNDAIFPK
jgi:DNA-binding NarL/FixJ family response regulator